MGRAVGQVDLPISAAGATSIQRLVTSWPGPAPDRLYSSDLARAASSAELLAEVWKLPVEVDARLREVHFGAWDGEAWEEIERREGERFKAWMKAWWQTPVPGGESFEAVGERAGAWLDELLADAAGQTIVAVGHGGSIRGLLQRALAMPLEKVFHLHLDHGRVSALATTRRGLEVTLLNADRFPTTNHSSF